MTALFDKFSILDPQRELNQVVTELGTNPFDRFSILDPVRYHKQIEIAANTTIFTQFSHDAEFAEDQMEAAFGTTSSKYLMAARLQASAGATSKSRAKLAALAKLPASASVVAQQTGLISMLEKAVASSGRGGV